MYKQIIRTLVILMIPVSALAGGDRITQSNDNNSQTTGDVLLGGSDNISISTGLADVDIAQCMASKQTNVVVFGWQRNEYNLFCMSQYYDSVGLHHMAALLRCNIPIIRDGFERIEDCVDLNTVRPIEVPRETSYIEPDNSALLARLDALEAENQEIQAEIDAQAASDARRRQNAIEAAQAERDYAQMILGELRDDDED
jgi:hypothetical protein